MAFDPPRGYKFRRRGRQVQKISVGTMRRSRSLSPLCVRASVPRARSWSPPRSIPVQALARSFRNDRKRRFSTAFFDSWENDPTLIELLNQYENDLMGSDDDDWEQDSALSTMLDGEQHGGGASTPLYDFTIQSLQARRNWKNVLHRQRFEVRLRQHRDPTPRDDLG